MRETIEKLGMGQARIGESGIGGCTPEEVLEGGGGEEGVVARGDQHLIFRRERLYPCNQVRGITLALRQKHIRARQAGVFAHLLRPDNRDALDSWTVP